MSTATVDRGTLIRARRSGACAQCGCDFAAGDRIYFSRESGSRHERCVSPASRPGPAADVADARRRAAGDDGDVGDVDWHRPCAAVADGDAAPAARRDGGADPRQSETPRRPAADERGDGDDGGGDRRREVAEALQLVIDAHAKLNEASQRIKRLLA